MSNKSVPNKSRRTLILMFVLLCAPIIASYALFFGNVRPGTDNYGDLLEVKTLTGTGLNYTDQTIFRVRDLRGKWALVSVDSGKCDEQCRQKLYYMRQVRLIQNAERERIERVWLIDDGELPSPELVKEFEGTWFINAKDSDLLKSIPGKTSQRDHIYVIDPIGNLMMRFPKDPDPKKMSKDIKRLLKVSQLEHAMGTDKRH
ncbi:Cytochrome oxidase Cu insertion factor, SCO1/SenC/PrrC family [Nitrosovibrio sp. Nv6]|nr:Cytochrome oxidase Cu insertion factor, SCO1/SenC/PrrC family [Nitrosovibrio sp. Nv6]